MKKITLSSAVLVTLLGSASAFAATICPGASAPAAGPGIVPASGVAGTNYMMRPIAPKCSANTQVDGTDGTSGAWFAVGANSVKGKNSFGGHTNGGAVAAFRACGIPGGCTAGEASAARADANTKAAAST